MTSRLGKVMQQQIIVDVREVVTGVPVEYFPFPEMFLPGDKLHIINFDDMVVFFTVFTNCSKRGLSLECSLNQVPIDLMVSPTSLTNQCETKVENCCSM